jgi:hypothetical protein
MIPETILIIGSMKSGTTTLFDLLARHPAIAPARNKEPGFFAFEEVFALGFGWYDALFAFDPARHRYGLEGSTDYTKHPFCTGVAERLIASAPRRFRLIYLMRHPLRRIESHARHAQLTRREVGRCTSPRADHSFDVGVSPVALAASRYAEQLERFAAFRDEGRLLPLVMEDLTRDQAGVLARVLAFLDLPHDPALDVAVHRNSIARPMRVPGYWQTLSGLGPLTAAVKALTPKTLRRRLRSRALEPAEIPGRFAFTPEEEASLLAALADDLAALRERWGIDTRAAWGL